MSVDLKNVDDFVIESVLGDNGITKVYRARQVSLDRWVALKMLPSTPEGLASIDNFYRKARAAAGMVHPNIIQIYTIGTYQGRPYYTMEYVDGQDLEKLLHLSGSTSFTTDEIVEVAGSVVKALHLAYQQGTMHRDIKPGNIMITKGGQVKVLDSGLAEGLVKLAGNPESVLGSAAYWAPEQGSQKPVDIRSDLYALGCVLYQCLCGEVPFVSDSVAGLAQKHRTETPRAPSAVRAGVNAVLEKICLRLIAKEPAVRYQKPLEVFEALIQVQANLNAAELALSQRVEASLQQHRSRSIARGAGATPIIVCRAGNASIGMEHSAQALLPSAPSKPSAFSTPGPSGSGNTQSSGGPADLTVSKWVRSESERVQTRTLENFLEKLPDGRWGYRWSAGACLYAEGFAASVPLAPNQKPNAPGDCLLCNNWSHAQGCVLRHTHEIKKSSSMTGVKALVEQAEAWLGTRNYEKAVALLDRHIKRNPRDPEGYYELARMYERAEYQGQDKRRAIVMYQRFIELALTKGWAKDELERVQAHVQQMAPALQAGTEPSSRLLAFNFKCFYRGRFQCFAFGLVDASQFTIARVGEIDPESGVSASTLGGKMVRATNIFRKFKSEQSLKDEQARARQELRRLAELSTDELSADNASFLAIGYEQIESAAMERSEGLIGVALKAGKDTHELLFNEADAFKAEQCQELVRRKLKK